MREELSGRLRDPALPLSTAPLHVLIACCLQTYLINGIPPQLEAHEGVPAEATGVPALPALHPLPPLPDAPSPLFTGPRLAATFAMEPGNELPHAGTPSAGNASDPRSEGLRTQRTPQSVRSLEPDSPGTGFGVPSFFERSMSVGLTADSLTAHSPGSGLPCFSLMPGASGALTRASGRLGSFQLLQSLSPPQITSAPLRKLSLFGTASAPNERAAAGSYSGCAGSPRYAHDAV